MSATTEARDRYNAEAIANMDTCVDPLLAPCADCGGAAYVVADNTPLCPFDLMVREDGEAERAGLHRIRHRL